MQIIIKLDDDKVQAYHQYRHGHLLQDTLDVDKVQAYHQYRHGHLLQDTFDVVLKQVGTEISEPGAIDGKIEMSGFGPIGNWEIV